jgi:dienelactone hydrolase
MLLRFLGLIVGIAVFALPIHAQEGLAFPEPTGEYQVGRTSYTFVDENREEAFTEETGDQREVLVRVYYPAEAAPGAAPAPYAEGALRDMLLIPGEQADLIQMHLYADAPAAEGSFPVLIFSPGMGALPVYYSSLLTEIASHGYIIAAVWHPYSMAVTPFPDGRVIPANAEGYLDPFLEPEASIAATERIGAVWTADDIFVLDQLENLNAADALLAGHLNLDQVGIFGHSFGGGAAAEASYQDSRFKAALNMDGPIFGSVTGQAMTQPFMGMFSTEWIITDAAVAGAGITREEYQATIDAYIAEYTGGIQALLDQAPVGYSAHIDGVAHFTFATDSTLLAKIVPEILPPETVGTLEGERVVEIIGSYVLAFFDQHLKGEASELLSPESTQYPEVEFELTGAE